MSKVDVLLDYAAGHLQTIEEHYEELLTEAEPPDELLYQVWALVNCCNAALDWTANDIAIKFGTKKKSPYFPLAPTANHFATYLERELKGLLSAEPDVAKAIERHQPYQSDKGSLAHIKRLAAVNKHQDFTVQRKRQFGQRVQEIHEEGPGYTADIRHTTMTGGEIAPGVHFTGPGLTINTPPGVRVTFGGQPLGDPATTRNETVIEWRFVEPDAPALATLRDLFELVDEAAEDIRHTAAL